MEEMGTAANHAVAAINEWGRREATVSPLLLPELPVLRPSGLPCPGETTT